MTEANDADRLGREGFLSWFLWRPWYAKLWWTIAALFWLTVLTVSMLAPQWARGTDTWFLSILPIILHPFIIVPVLALRLYRRMLMQETFAWPRRWRQDESGYELPRDGVNIGFPCVIDPASMHPADPLSPTNPASPYYRLHHGDH